MNFDIGDLVTRNSYKNDILFKIISVEEDIALLKGVDLRLYADSDIDDLKKEKERDNEDKEILEENIRNIIMDRNKYFYLPGKILHIDGDSDYLKRCMDFYQEMNVKANGLTVKEDAISDNINELLEEFKPDI